MNDYLQRRKRYNMLVPDSFIERSGKKITQAVIDAQGLLVLRDGKRMFGLKQSMSKKDVKEVLKSIRG